MPIDPRTLESIRNPMAGLSNIGAQYAQGVQVAQSRQAMEAQRNAQQLQMADIGSKITGAYATAMINWKEDNPDASSEAFETAQLQQWQALDSAHQQFVPQTTQSIDELKLGRERSEQIQRSLHPENFRTKTAGSEFERLDELVNRGNATPAQRKRHSVLAGTGMRLGEIERLGEKRTERTHREEKALRKEYSEGSEHFRGMSETIDSAFAAMDSGNTALSETLLNQVMSQVQDTNVRAFQMYGEFDKEFGNVAQRIQGMLSRFFAGTRTQRETEEIRNVLTRFKENYVNPANKKLRDRYRVIAIDQGKDPFTVVPPGSPEDVIESRLLNNKEKAKLIKRVFPDWSPE